jgi:DNA gyrase/topoisomerase IV subunit B
MTTATKQNYSSDDIETLRYPDDVRSNPGVYIGGVDALGLFTILRECTDNALDEYLAGRGSQVHIFFDDDGSYWIHDDADGVPQGIKTHKVRIKGKDVVVETPTMQAIFGELHTSGKYHSEAYKVSRGSHGIGVKATNALSEYFDVWTKYRGKWYFISFERGKLSVPVSPCKAPPEMWNGEKAEGGTLIHFKADPKIFSVKTFPPSLAVEWSKLAAYLSPGFRVILESPKGKHEFFSERGPLEYIEKQMEKLGCESERQMFQYKSELADVIIAFTSYDKADIRGFVNGLAQSQGGKHVDSVSGALYAAIKPWVKTKKVKIDGKSKEVPAFREADFREGMIGLVNLYLHKATYSSQDKAKLSDDRAGAPFEKMLTDAAAEFFKNNKALAQRLADRASRISELKSKFTLSKAAASRLNAMRRGGLPAKFASWQPGSKSEDRELFLVEGDSAAGTAKEARLPYQGILPLRGKIANALKNSEQMVLESEEVLSILAAIGFDINAADPYARLNVGKIICLADPDPDGPFVGDTKVRIRRLDDGDLGMQPHEVTIETLSKNPNRFEVEVWDGGKVIWADATASLVKNVDALVSLSIAGTTYKVSADHKFLVHTNVPSMYGRDVTLVGWENLGFVRAIDLRIGDRVFMPSNNGSRKPNEADKMTKLGFAPVSKMRAFETKEPTPVYCLTVPKYHNFVLPSGIVSSNCHINSLLLALFYRYLPNLFERGMIYVMHAPEFYAKYNGEVFIGDRLSEVQSKLKEARAPASTEIRHVKGYGELPKALMRMMCMDPNTRRLIRIKAIDGHDHTDFVRLMNDDVEYRKEILNLPRNADTSITPVKQGDTQPNEEKKRNATSKKAGASADA